jgi:hypothetical protein
MSNFKELLSQVGNELTYSAKTGSFLTQGFTSVAGNTYFNSIRISSNLVIQEDVGQGYARTFLNGLHIFTKEGSLLAEARYHCEFYSTDRLQYLATQLLLQSMLEAGARKGQHFQVVELERAIAKEIAQSIRPQSEKQLRYLLCA